MADNIAVSLVMPVYNTEKYLCEALDSAVGQTLRDIELICIDDGSTDASPAILEEYASKDGRIRVHHQPNGGYGKAMNAGLERARGKYIAVLEPDDFLDFHMLEDLYRVAEKHQLDFVKSDFAFVEGEPGNYQVTQARIYWKDSMYGKVLSHEEKLELFRGYLAYWTCLYRRDFIENRHIRFNETPGASYQDTGFWFQTMALAGRACLHDGCYYHYRMDNAASSMLSKEKVYCISEEYDFIRRNLEDRGLLEEYWPQYVAFCFIGHRDAMHRIAGQYRKEFILHIAEDFGKMKAAGKLDTSFMEQQDREMLERILENPGKFWKEMEDVPRYIHQQLAPYREFCIYGAGTRAKKIYQYLSDEDKANFHGFLVTRKDRNQLLGQPIQALDDVKASPDMGIIVGVTERYQQEIVDTLDKNDFKTAIILPEKDVP